MIAFRCIMVVFWCIEVEFGCILEYFGCTRLYLIVFWLALLDIDGSDLNQAGHPPLFLLAARCARNSVIAF